VRGDATTETATRMMTTSINELGATFHETTAAAIARTK
jgi:hypothetical protein